MAGGNPDREDAVRSPVRSVHFYAGRSSLVDITWASPKRTSVNIQGPAAEKLRERLTALVAEIIKEEKPK